MPVGSNSSRLFKFLIVSNGRSHLLDSLPCLPNLWLVYTVLRNTIMMWFILRKLKVICIFTDTIYCEITRIFCLAAFLWVMVIVDFIYRFFSSTNYYKILGCLLFERVEFHFKLLTLGGATVVTLSFSTFDSSNTYNVCRRPSMSAKCII